MAKNLFKGLVKISGNNWDAYQSAITEGAGKIVFADITSKDHVGKYIYANGIEYKVADASDFSNLVKRVEDVSQYAIDVSTVLNDLSTYVRTTVDSSVNALETWRSTHADPSLNAFDSSLINHETRIKNLEDASSAFGQRIANVSQNVIDISTYVHTTVNTSINDISTRLSNVGITAADNSIYVNGTSIAVEGDSYVNLTTANNKLSAAIKDSALTKGTGTGADDVSLATKGYVDEQVAVLEQALVFKGDITSTADASSKLTDGAVQAGWTYVATAEGTYNNKNFESGDLLIVKEDSAASSVANVIIVERNLDGAVTAAAGLTDDYVILGSGNQTVKVSSIEVNALMTAIANANSAIHGVNANSSTATFVEVQATTDASIVNISVGAKTHDVSTATSDVENGLATAKATKEYVDAKADAIKVQATLNSSTPNYVDASASVDAAGRIISASVGVVTATLADASNGSTGLAMAEDVYTELAKVEEVTATSITAMADTLGLDSSLGVTWSAQSGIPSDATYKEAIEGAYEEAHKAGVTSFGEKTGAISVGAATNANDVSFWMDGSTLKGSVNYTGLEARIADVSQHAINNDASITDISTRVIPALQAKDVEIDASIDRLDASVSALENANYVNTLSGESAITGGDGSFVAVKVDTSTGDVTLSSELKLAENTYGSTTATGLATDAFIKDYLAWEVIGE